MIRAGSLLTKARQVPTTCCKQSDRRKRLNKAIRQRSRECETIIKKMIEVAQANTAGVFEFARQLSAAKSSFDLVELWTRHAKTQTGILGEQIKELAELGQEFAGESAAPIARSLTPVFKKASSETSQ